MVGAGILYVVGLGVVVWVGVRDNTPCNAIVSYNGTAGGGPSERERGVGTPSPILPNVSEGRSLLIAILGDQTLSHNAKQVLRLVRNEGASMVFHLGDFDYRHAPDLWTKQLFSVLGEDRKELGERRRRLVLDYFAVVGNHDAETNADAAGYTRRIAERLHPEAAQCCCEGYVGVRATCVWKGVAILQVGKGCTNCFAEGIEEWLRGELQRLGSDYPWKFCMWHKNQADIQMGTGWDEMGWELYEECRKAGAIVLTGHDHRYARTHLISKFGSPPTVDASGNNTNTSVLRVRPGRTFAVVSGLGGHSMRWSDPDRMVSPWWASHLSRESPLAEFGALFLRIGVYGDARHAQAYFKTTKGDIVDTFEVYV